ncbi:hypothetical protein NE237_004356 [Protea cynaroides]|uniref:Uncharacterized protein n=1 Tax=Protea cynaroides TaxID=273540 RepID=A0A9Q0KIM2_9MAGN|nr:hypothetical protein NE237_004356 [Protea cynaroides]
MAVKFGFLGFVFCLFCSLYLLFVLCNADSGRGCSKNSSLMGYETEIVMVQHQLRGEECYVDQIKVVFIWDEPTPSDFTEASALDSAPVPLIAANSSTANRVYNTTDNVR